MLVSIILPIYNVADLITRCMDSIYSQDVDDSSFEIIAVNDGSSDNSKAVVKEYQKIHDNIILIEQKNGGVASARNNGINHSSGDYLIFVDPDDALCECALASFMKLVNKRNSPIFVMRSFNNDADEVYVWHNLYKSGDKKNCIEAINQGYVRGSVCGCAFKRDFIVSNKIQFPVGVRNGEDTFFFFLCMGYCDELFFYDIKFYNVIGRENSASRSYSVERIQKCIESVKLVDSIIHNEHNIIRLDLFNFLKFILLLNTLTTTLHTPRASLFTLRKYRLPQYKHMECRMITYKKKQMRLLSSSISISYLILKVFQR